MSNKPLEGSANGAETFDYYAGVNPLLLQMIPTDCRRILEVGCAMGMLGAAIKLRNYGSYYVGIELFDDVAKHAEKVLDRVYVADVEKFDWSLLAYERFDCIIFADVLEHLLKPEVVIRAAMNLLSPNGTIVCCIPNVCHWSIISGLLKGEWEYADNGLLDRTHLRFYTQKTFEKLLEECGLVVLAEGRFVNEVDIGLAILPVLKALNMDHQTFINNATTYQFALRARKK
jgi:2-polyprenyl-3-methyl-5-hydroxy-6-metoxy-1,4-benzoquinol methylase